MLKLVVKLVILNAGRACVAVVGQLQEIPIHDNRRHKHAWQWQSVALSLSALEYVCFYCCTLSQKTALFDFPIAQSYVNRCV